ncbi:hypothetical protein [Xanthomonas sp. SS]|uniref:hypothetical protein n=1 Tax=Xanthomonas sp. SS TaxID=2724122 RepID=UPI00163A5C86|nr:hypothetical protein [Xanthomonas sp. SS]
MALLEKPMRFVAQFATAVAPARRGVGHGFSDGGAGGMAVAGAADTALLAWLRQYWLRAAPRKNSGLLIERTSL